MAAVVRIPLIEPTVPSPSARLKIDPGEIDLALDDLLADARGEIVLFNDSGLRAMTVSARAAVIERGRADRHVTLAGEDVTGYRFLAFDDGTKLFFDPMLHLEIVPG